MPSATHPTTTEKTVLFAGVKPLQFGPRRHLETEWLDAPGHSRETLAGNFRDIALLNRWFGGWNLTDKCLLPFLPDERPATVTMLDLASGAADVPLALAQRWQKRSIKLKIIALDIDPTIVELAREAATQEKAPNFEAIAADAFAYPFPEGQHFDFVTCSLAFHHFTPEMCVEMLRLMARLGGKAFVVNDLRRSWFGWGGSKLLTWLVARHPFTRHDGPLSILRSYTVVEMEALVKAANLDAEWKVSVRPGPFSRLAVVGKRL